MNQKNLNKVEMFYMSFRVNCRRHERSLFKNPITLESRLEAYAKIDF